MALANLLTTQDVTNDGQKHGLPTHHLRHGRLLDFFGKPPKPHTRGTTDLTIERPEVIWDAALGLDARRPSQGDLEKMRKEGRDLWEQYDDWNSRDDTISRYLQHCTTYRIDRKDWHPDQMMDEIREILEIFESHLPEFKPATNSASPSTRSVVTVSNRGHVTSSSATVVNWSSTEMGASQGPPDKKKS